MASPGHMERCGDDPLAAAVAITTSAFPRVLDWDRDVVKMSRQQSTEYWLTVAGSSPSASSPFVPEQLLPAEEMVIDPAPAAEGPVMVEIGTQADLPLPRDEILQALDELKGMVRRMSDEVQKVKDRSSRNLEATQGLRRDIDRQRGARK